jgi:nitrile hydratase subunit beta
MNGVHDCGGMDGMGPMPEDDGLQFHAEWERVVQGLVIGIGQLGRYGSGEFRGTVEDRGNARLLSVNYFERWLLALEHLEKKYRFTEMEPPPGGPPLTLENLPAMLSHPGHFHADLPLEPRFAVGDAVRSRNYHPKGHTRLPRYARDKPGIVTRCQGVFYSPEFFTPDGHPMAQHVYTVRFSARALWGEAINESDGVYLDLWEEHLLPAAEPAEARAA